MNLLEGLSIGGYRSFGSEVQRIGPLQKVNLFAGPNNCGKSNILRFLKDHFHNVVGLIAGQGPQQRFEDVDRHRSDPPATFCFGVGTKSVEERFTTAIQTNSPLANNLQSILRSDALSDHTELAWFEYFGPHPGAPMALAPHIVDRLLKDDILTADAWRNTWHALTSLGAGDIREHWIPETLKIMSPVGEVGYPEVAFVPAIREIKEGSDSGDLSGTGLIDQLAHLQNPPYQKQDDKKRFEAINHFLRTVTANASATLDVPHSRDMIIVHMDGKTLPLEALGTGIHEVIILAAAATIVVNQLVCIEEPEIHLHPVLQRRLIQYLLDNTSNQYFIATHSAHLLDTTTVAVFRVSMQDGQTRVSCARRASDTWEICRDLGYRASDILQSNCIIWVEGPSDRVYLNLWIQACDATLIEGVHYSIMFYGGRLLRHLTADDPEVDEFISLRRLNRHLVVVMDRDRTTARADIGKTKMRVRDEFDSDPGFAWVTGGREIENYVEEGILRAAVEAVAPGAGKRIGTGRFDHAIPYVEPKGKTLVRVDKMKVAHEVASRPPVLDVWDLKKRIKQLVAFVHHANV